MTDEVDQDNNDLHGGRWANMWLTIFFVLQAMVMFASLGLNFCLIRAMARNANKETSVIYMALIFFFFTSLVDTGLIFEEFMANQGYQSHTTGICQFVTFVMIGNRLLQSFGVIALSYFTWTIVIFKTKKIENMVRQFFPFIVGGFIILEIIFAIPPAMNLEGTPHKGWCKYKNYDFHSTILVNWLYYVLFPYFIPLILCAYPFGYVLYKLRIVDSVSSRDRNHFQIVLAVVGGYFFFHFLYYLLWFGRQMESLVYFNDRGAYRNFLSQPAWIIARPLFALINLGWHVTTPLAPFIFDNELLEEFPGPWINKHRSALLASRRQEDIEFEERSQSSSSLPERGVITKKTEFHNPLPDLEDEREYHQIPL